MNRAHRMAWQGSLLLFAATAVVLTLGHHPALRAAAQPPATPPSFYYGTNGAYMDAAILNIWPQENGPYCALATASAVINYIDQEDHLPMRFTYQASQFAIATANQTSGESQWGYATPINSTAGITNIAPDRGVDPRAAAYVQAHYAPSGTVFHDYIYRWQFHSTQEPTYHVQVLQATTALFRSWLSYTEPMSVIINGGEHSVVVSGGWMGNDIRFNNPANLQGVIVRDPEFAGTISRFEVTPDQWLNHGTNFGAGYYTLWARYYGVNPDGSINHDDPEPTVGIYRPNGSNPYHWYQGFTWIRRDNQTANGLSNPDWAFTDSGVLLTAP